MEKPAQQMLPLHGGVGSGGLTGQMVTLNHDPRVLEKIKMERAPGQLSQKTTQLLTSVRVVNSSPMLGLAIMKKE